MFIFAGNINFYIVCAGSGVKMKQTTKMDLCIVTVTRITEDRELSFIDPTKLFMMSTLHKILKTSFLDLTKSEPDPPEDISIKRSI